MVGKKIASVVMSAVLAVSLCPGAAFASELEAGEMPDQVAKQAAEQVAVQASKNLKQRGVKFDLANGKSFKVKRFLKGVGNRSVTARLSGLKVKSAGDGMKQATFTVKFSPDKRLTKAQGQKVLKAFKKAYYDQGGDQGNASSVVWDEWMIGKNYVWLVDRATGKNLEEKGNSSNVTSTMSWTQAKVKKYESADNWWFTDPGMSTVKCTVTFPESYKNLCVGIGADTIPHYNWTKADANFTGGGHYVKNGKVMYEYANRYTAKYWQTSWFKKMKGNYHFMSVK